MSSTDLEADSDRWPIFAPRAVAAGFRSVQALPLRLRGQVLGALNLFLDRTGGARDVDQAAAQAMADVATIGLLQQRTVHDTNAAANQLRTALRNRVVIEQAKGILAEQTGLDPDAAFQRLRQFARDHNHKLAESARAVINGEISGADLT